MPLSPWRSYVATLSALAFALGVALAGCDAAGPEADTAAARPEKVPVCHYDAATDTYSKVLLVEQAVAPHLGHGDRRPGDLVPGAPTYVVEDDCSLDEFVPFECSAEAGRDALDRPMFTVTAVINDGAFSTPNPYTVTPGLSVFPGPDGVTENTSPTYTPLDVDGTIAAFRGTVSFTSEAPDDVVGFTMTVEAGTTTIYYSCTLWDMAEYFGP